MEITTGTPNQTALPENLDPCTAESLRGFNSPIYRNGEVVGTVVVSNPLPISNECILFILYTSSKNLFFHKTGLRSAEWSWSAKTIDICQKWERKKAN